MLTCPRIVFLSLFLLLFLLLFPAPAPADAPLPAVAETPDYPGAVWAPASPANFWPSSRPSPAQPIDRIVIHDIEGTVPDAVRHFQDSAARVSSHYVVDGETGRVTQMVRERDIAWHAGDGPTNARSIGIEHAGYAYRPGFFNAVEYEASARLIRAIARRYAIPRDRTHIIGHFEVPDSAHPGHFGGRNGHTDPGPYWDWGYFMALVRSDARSGPGPLPPVFVLHPGQTARAEFLLVNTGDDPWPADADAAGRALGPVYLGVWGRTGSALSGPDWVSPRFVTLPVGGDTAPGASGRFIVPLHVPPAFLGRASAQFRLFRVPAAPGLPVPFGPVLTASVRVAPWDIRSTPGGRVALPAAGAWDVSVRRVGRWRRLGRFWFAGPAAVTEAWGASAAGQVRFVGPFFRGLGGRIEP